jgi:hypothetical protein
VRQKVGTGLSSCKTTLPSARDLAIDKEFFIFFKYTSSSACDPTLGKEFIKKIKLIFVECFQATLDKDPF